MYSSIVRKQTRDAGYGPASALCFHRSTTYSFLSKVGQKRQRQSEFLIALIRGTGCFRSFCLLGYLAAEMHVAQEIALDALQ